MTPEQYQRARELFHHVAELDRATHEAFLDERCDDEVVRAEVLRLIAIDASETEDPLDRAPAAPLSVPDEIGPYRIGRMIGRGGMGAVFEAEQDNPRRTVAIKLINPGQSSPKLLHRFELEANVLGRLQHPGIAQIFEAGTFDIGAGAQPYFAMELVHGVPLTDYVETHALGTRQRLALVARICSAVHHAHQRGVVHRDLKPANILATETDDGPQPKILDFGVARATDGDVQTTTMRTDVGQIIGTIAYMSPEQASGDPNNLDTRSDVYALGVIAYEVLAGHLPYSVKDRMLHEAVRVIREETPTRLSSIDRVFRGDVETIVSKSLEKEPDRRYQSAAELAADIERYLGDEPIVARPPSAAYQFHKFARRNRALVGGIVAVAITLVVATVVAIVLAIRANEARKDADIAAGKEAVARNDADAARLDAEERARLANLAAAGASLEIGASGIAKTRLADIPDEARDWAWHILWNASDQAVAMFELELGHTSDLDLSPTDDRFAVACAHGVALGSLANGVDHVIEGGAHRVSFSSDGRRIVVAANSWVRVFETRSGETVYAHEFDTNVNAVAFVPDGTAIYSAQGGVVRRHELVGGEITSVVDHPGVNRLAVHENGTTLALVATSGGVSQMNLTTGRVHPIGTGVVRWVGFNRQGGLAYANHIASIHGLGVVFYSTATVDRHLRGIVDVGDYYAVALGDAVHMFDLDGREVEVLLGHPNEIAAIARSHDRSLVASVSVDGTLAVWPARPLDRVPVDSLSMACKPGCDVVATIGPEGDGSIIKTWNLQSGERRNVIDSVRGAASAFAFDRWSPRLAMLDEDELFLDVFDTVSNVRLTSLETNFAGLASMDFLPDGSLLAGGNKKLARIDLDTGDRLWSSEFNGSGPIQMAIDPDARRVVLAMNVAGRGLGVPVVDVETGEAVHTLDVRHATAVAFDPRGRLVATGNRHREVDVWDAASYERVRAFPEHGGTVMALAFHPRLDLLATLCDDRRVRVWNLESGELILSLDAGGSDELAFAADGDILVAHEPGHGLRTWHVRSRRARLGEKSEDP